MVLVNRTIILTSWSILIRWAGCAWNDTIDQDLDKQISRTKLRPLPRGAISTSQALGVTAVLFLAAGALPMLLLPSACLLEVAIIIFFALLYPFGKRFTHHPQLILMNIGWGIPMSMHSLDLDPTRDLAPTICLGTFLGLMVVLIDVLYARQDLAEDLKVGVKSMAVHYRSCIWTLIYGLYASSIGLLVVTGWLARFGLPFFLLSVGGYAVGFMILLYASNREPSSRVERYSKWALLMAMSLLIEGLSLERRRCV
jgi:4-hydroxybenzoate polyprenyltransferase